MSDHFMNTPHGFEWGAAILTRCFSHNGFVTLRLTNQRGTKDMQITVSPSGRIRVADDNGEWKPVLKQKRK